MSSTCRGAPGSIGTPPSSSTPPAPAAQTYATIRQVVRYFGRYTRHPGESGLRRRGGELGRPYQKDRAATGRAGDAPDAALVDDLAGPQHVLSEQRLEAAESESMSRTREYHARGERIQHRVGRAV